ncbi:DUF4229 domain-containing protein [Nocardioides sp. R-C-SC26]|uniref:DUF4229 domain-containing protein n=1 Tax=Nocardioides sp. R-C-SC26 TaxID=2870414 RepID=UPI001E36755C|nr:DUF4229 domain-containing protein [Nocardioides sp. R-C-SC26]
MKEFWIYTLARIALFAVTWGMVAGAWLLVTGEASLGWSLIIAFILSGIGSYVVLQGPREALAQRVQTRAASATTRYEEMRSKEDTD